MKKFFSFVPVLILGLAMYSTMGPDTEGGLSVGDKAPDFKLANIFGEQVSLSDFPEAKGFIVTFTCNHCPYAVMYEDRLIELHNKYAPMGYPVIAINPNDPEVVPEDSYANMKIRAEEKVFPFQYLFDRGQKVYPAYGATRTPHVFLLDANLIVRYIGAIDDNAREPEAVEVRYVENAINAMENGEAIDPDFTKAVGCSIKTK
ncbi:MAG: thioredoxin family protein [Saprospiraceae bacterium]|nr:thioredoxin family protein [Saprospiraceae bacterium]